MIHSRSPEVAKMALAYVLLKPEMDHSSNAVVADTEDKQNCLQHISF